MIDERGKKQLVVLSGLGALVLAIAIWAFVMECRTNVAEAVTDRNPVGAQSAQETEGKSEKILDTEALAQTVLENVSFDTELEKVDDAVTESMIAASSEETQIALYMGEGTCADELLIVTVDDEKHVEAEVQNVQKHLTDMQQSFQDYLPKEAKKIEDAVILQSGKYIVACVTGDRDTAGSVLKKQLK